MKMKKQRVPPWATSPMLACAPAKFEIWKSLMFEGDILYLALIRAVTIGVSKKMPYEQVCRLAKAAGFDLCPRASHFKLTEYPLGMAEGETIHYASEPYESGGTKKWIVRLRQIGGHVARGSAECGEDLFGPEDLFIFRIP